MTLFVFTGKLTPSSLASSTTSLSGSGSDSATSGWFSWLWSWVSEWFYGPDISLHDCLAYFFSADELKGDNMYSCEKCKFFSWITLVGKWRCRNRTTEGGQIFISANSDFESVVFNSGKKMALRAFYFIRALTKALTYYYISRYQRHLLDAIENNWFGVPILSMDFWQNKTMKCKIMTKLEKNWQITTTTKLI